MKTKSILFYGIAALFIFGTAIFLAVISSARGEPVQIPPPPPAKVVTSPEVTLTKEGTKAILAALKEAVTLPKGVSDEQLRAGQLTILPDGRAKISVRYVLTP